MRAQMQAEPFIYWIQARLITAVIWLAQLCGLELVRSGWRQIPAGHSDFDPLLADYFKQAGMRNGKHINMAVNYAVIAKWNRSNKKRGRDGRTYGSDSYYARNYTEVDRKTWARHMDELAALGLVVISTMNGKPAYQAVQYRFADGGSLNLVNISHDQRGGHGDQWGGHDAQRHGHDAQRHGHDAHHTIESIKKILGFESFKSKTASAARDAADVDDIHPGQIIDVKKPEPPDLQAARDGIDELLNQVPPANMPKPSPPFPPPPPSHFDTTAQDSTLEEPADTTAQDLQTFFTGCDVAQIKALIDQHGAGRIYATIATVKQLPNVENPPGLVRYMLGIGGPAKFTYPQPKADASDWLGSFKPKGGAYEPASA